MLLALALSGCAAPCHLALTYDGEMTRPLYLYHFQPGVTCVY